MQNCANIAVSNTDRFRVLCYISYNFSSFAEKEYLMEKWECTVCGWIYDPAVGDPDGGIAPGTAFEKIPDSWVCPVCGATKDAFKKL